MDINASPDSTDGLDAWVRAAWPRAVVYATSLLRDRPAAEDIVQECFCNLLRKSAVYDLHRDGMKLLMKSISNACLKKSTRERPLQSLTAPGQNGDWRSIDPEDHGVVEPTSAALHTELERAVASALAQLPAIQRAAVELKGLGHSHRQIAEILDVTASNAGVLIHRGRQTLAQLLAPYLESESDERPSKRPVE